VHFERKQDLLGSWSESNFVNWRIDSGDEFIGQFGLRSGNVGVDANVNLSNAQKELLLWHLKLGVSMQHIQELMRVSEMKEPNGRIRTMDRVIVPKHETAATCEIPECQSCLLSRAKQRKPKVVDTKPVKSAEGAISRDKYQSGDFVSIDQYVVRNPGRLPTGYGQGSDTNMFHGGTIFRDAVSKYIYVRNQVSLGTGETVTAKREFEDFFVGDRKSPCEALSLG